MYRSRYVTYECDLQTLALMGTSLVVSMMNDVTLAN